MAEFPRELIRQVQISTRAAAGLSGYDPSDPTLPALPSLSAAIAALEPSSPNLRCVHCKGRLLRGLESSICAYCGARCQHDVVPDPIFFNTTIGYQWLLSFLNLDGSEFVVPPDNKIEQDQGQGSPKTEIPLSDFLKFGIFWSADKEKKDSIAADKLSEENKGFLNLTRVEPDNFFFKLRRDDVEIGSTGTKEVAALDSHISSQSVQSPGAAGWLTSDKSGEAFSEWKADFQSAFSGNQQDVSMPSDHFVGLSADSGELFQDSQSSHTVDVDLSTHMDSVFGHKMDPTNGKPADHAVASPSSDWNSDDLWTNMGTNKSQLVGEFDSTVNVEDDHLSENLNDLSTNSDLFNDFQWQTSNTDIHENKTTNGAHITMNESHDVGRVDGRVSVNDVAIKASNSDPKSADLFQDFQWQNDEDIADNKTVNEDQISMNQSQPIEDSFSTVSVEHDLTLENSADPSTKVDLFQDFQWLTNETDTFENERLTEGHNTANDDSFDEWNDFTASTSVQDPSLNAWIQSDHFSDSITMSSDVDFFSPSSKLKDGDIGSFSPLTAMSALADDKNTTEFNDILPETRSNRLSDTSSPYNALSETVNSAYDVGTFSRSKEDVNMLISQMHDLSFMLKTDLCIPSASGTHKSSDRD